MNETFSRLYQQSVGGDDGIWLALIAGLVIALVTIRYQFPVFANRPAVQLRPLKSDRKISVQEGKRALTWNAFCESWPESFNLLITLVIGLIGSTLILFGLGANWIYNGIFQAVQTLQQWVGLKSALPTQLISTLPLLALIIGTAMIVIGLGMLLRKEAARLACRGLIFSLQMGAVLVWPQILILPARWPGQRGIVLVFGSVFLLTLSIAARGLDHQLTQRLYQIKGDV